MRLLFINETHPATQHVAGMRLHHFANALARRGHEVLHLTGPDPHHDGPALAMLDGLKAHDWSEPFVLPISPPPPRPSRSVDKPELVRRARILWSFLQHGGPFPEWGGEARLGAALALTRFQPDLIWTTFGNSSNLAVARSVARDSRCPWVIDFKDNWETFTPPALRMLLAKRFGGATGATANSAVQQHIAARWFPQLPTRLCYSGVADEFFARDLSDEVPDRGRTLLLVGGTYDRDMLRAYLAAVAQWRGKLAADERIDFRFHYLGSDHALVRAEVAHTELAGCATIDEYLPLGEFVRHVRRAFCCSYLWAPHGFHHKLLELLVASRSVVAFPGEHPESRFLASQSETPFHVCASAKDLAAALGQCWANAFIPAKDNCKPDWRWDDFAVGLEAYFLQLTAIR
jgi:hypothetical protein